MSYSVSVDVVVHETNREEIANSEIDFVHRELQSLHEKIQEAGVQNKHEKSGNPISIIPLIIFLPNLWFSIILHVQIFLEERFLTQMCLKPSNKFRFLLHLPLLSGSALLVWSNPLDVLRAYYVVVRTRPLVHAGSPQMSYPEFTLRNKYLKNAEEDFLYHFGFGINTIDIPKVFGDTKSFISWNNTLLNQHGMGSPSLSIMLVEAFKLMHHAKAHDVKFIRLGTSGGVGVEPGTVVVSTAAMNGELEDKYVQWIAGRKVGHIVIKFPS
uniref:PNP_UDP_1 domain-containing protein n=1 Tax=Heterorhabditis bacteriophora TaxID=37862 RepID=A0A1I7X8G8_HETBA